MQLHRAGSLAVQAVGRGLHLHMSCCLPRHAPHPALHRPGGLRCTFCLDQSDPGAFWVVCVSWRVQAPCIL